MHKQVAVSVTSVLFATLLLAAGWSEGATITNLPTLGGSVVLPKALNRSGQIAGYSYLAGNAVQYGFLYSGGISYNLGSLGGSVSEASGINSAGRVIGNSALVGDTEFHAFLFDGRVLIDLGTLGGSVSSAKAINDVDAVVGDSYTAGDGESHAFLYSEGTMQDLGTLGGSGSSAMGVNRAGHVAGHSLKSGDFAYEAFLFSGGTLRGLGTLGGSDSYATAINDAGQVVGDSYTAGGDYHAFLYESGRMRDLGTLGGTYSTAVALNPAGHVVGNSLTAEDACFHAFFYRDGVMRDLGTLGGTYCSAYALNNLGQVVGEADDAQGQVLPFLWEEGVMQNLNDLLPPNSGWALAAATFINDAGQIVGYGTYRGVFEWYLLTLGTPNQPPLAEAGPDQTVECDLAVALDGRQSTDPDQDPLTYQWREGATVLALGATASVSLPLGVHVLTLKVTDSHDASAEDTLVVTVQDTTPPSVVAPGALTAAADGNCQAVVPQVTASLQAQDDCTATTALATTQSPASGTLVTVGVHTVTLTVTDASGNSSSVTTTFTVVDTTPPVGTCPESLGAAAGPDGTASVPDFAAALVASDNCTPTENLVKTQMPAAGTSVGLATHTITVTVTDAAGNSSTCTTTFTVIDTTPPALTCPAGETASADAEGQVSVPDFAATVAAQDNCTPTENLIKTQMPAVGTRVGPGTHTITVTVTDAAGNSSTCTTTFTVTSTTGTDTVPPVINAASVTPNVLSKVNLQMVPVIVSVRAKDNLDPAPVCRIISITSNADRRGLLPDWKITGPLTAKLRAERNKHGAERIYTLTVACTDASGNTSTTQLTVRVPARH